MDTKQQIIRSFATLGGVASLLSIITGIIVHCFQPQIRESQIFLSVLLGGIIVSVFGLALAGIVLLYHFFREQQRTLSPRIGRRLNLLRAVALSLPDRHAKARRRFLGFQTGIVEAAGRRKDLGGVNSDSFKDQVLTPLFMQMKEAIDEGTSADVSVQMKLFPLEVIEKFVCDDVKFNWRDHYLSSFHQVNSNELRRKHPCQTVYKLFDVQANDAEATRHEYQKWSRANSVEENVCASSALNTLFGSSENHWIANCLSEMEQGGQYFCDSPCYDDRDFNSQALFLMTESIGAVSHDNPALGVLIVESKARGRFDNEILADLGSYFSNRLFFFLKNAIQESQIESASNTRNQMNLNFRGTGNQRFYGTTG